MKLGHVTQARPLKFILCYIRREAPSCYVCTKFEADRSFCSKLLGGPEILKLGHVTPATPT